MSRNLNFFFFFSERSAYPYDLWRATNTGDEKKVRALLENWADPNDELYWSEEWITKWKKTPPLHTACGNGHLGIVKILTNGGAKIGINCL